jgi:hypothetical protein
VTVSCPGRGAARAAWAKRAKRAKRPWSLVGTALVVFEGLPGCAQPAVQVPTGAAPTRVAAAEFAEGLSPLPRYHSSRFSASLPLPDGRAWRIDDHSRPELVATHAPTRSSVLLSVFRADDLVGRAQCELLARVRKLVPNGDLRTLEDDATLTQQTFDTRVWVAVDPGRGPNGTLGGYVMAFGGFLRKCFVFVFSTQVEDASDEPVLSSRLAFARARILGGLELDIFGAIPRDQPASGESPR